MNATGTRIHRSTQDTVLSAICYIFVGLFALLCLIPFIYVVSASFSSQNAIAVNGFRLLPQDFSVAAYEMVFKGSQIWYSYAVTIFTTFVGTAASLFFTSLFAYPLATRRLRFGNAINFYVYFTMLFSGGLVPSYILTSKYLHLSGTIWVYIIPSLMSVWNMFLLRNFFSAIPASLSESARIDGANDFQILVKIILPCAKPALATVGLFYALGYWNEWYRTLLYNSGDKQLWTLQFLIYQMMNKAETIKNMAQEGMAVADMDVPTTTMKMATAICTIGPVILAYPFAQKYFTKGLIVGSVKG